MNYEAFGHINSGSILKVLGISLGILAYYIKIKIAFLIFGSTGLGWKLKECCLCCWVGIYIISVKFMVVSFS